MDKFKQFLTSNSKSTSHSESTQVAPNSTRATSTIFPQAQAVSDSKISDASNHENHLSLLSKYDVVLVVDDSGSMGGSRWKEARKALEVLASEAAKYDKDGIEIQFLNSNEMLTTTNPEEVKSLFKRIKPEGRTPLGAKIGKLLKEYIEAFIAKHLELKPVIYIVITDGAATDGPKTEEAIIRTAKALDECNAKPDQIGIQFVQIGSDSAATEYLEMLDDMLTAKAGIRDMVDTTPSRHGVKLDLIKILLGSVNRRVDRRGSSALIGG